MKVIKIPQKLKLLHKQDLCLTGYKQIRILPRFLRLLTLNEMVGLYGTTKMGLQASEHAYGGMVCTTAKGVEKDVLEIGNALSLIHI